jgi:superfamily II DNA or RNA helicase
MRFRFDGGTVLLESKVADAIARSLPGLRWDARVGAFRAPASAWPRIREALGRESAEGMPAATPVRDGWSRVELRPYQEAALSAWEVADRRGIVVLPTGAGKTVVALAAMARSGLTTLCMVPTRVLLDQWKSAIETITSVPVGRLGDGTRDIERITVSTYESAYRTMHALGRRFELLVVDEVHHFGSGIRDEALEMSLASARLGLTATPPREPAALERLAETVGRVVYELSVGDLSGAYLAPFDLITLPIDLTEHEAAAYERLMRQFRPIHQEFCRLAPGGSWKAFLRYAAGMAGGRRALAALREAMQLIAYTEGKRAALGEILRRHRESRVLVFTSHNQAAYAAAREHLIMPITCHIGRDERREVLDRFRRGDLRALVSARVLNEGVDIPDADVAVVLAGSMGEREHVQRVGRVLRPRENKRAIVYELVADGTTETAKSRRRRAALEPRAIADTRP